MPPKTFQHEHVDPELYSRLDTPRATASFRCLVYDYMEYLHSDP